MSALVVVGSGTMSPDSSMRSTFTTSCVASVNRSSAAWTAAPSTDHRGAERADSGLPRLRGHGWSWDHSPGAATVVFWSLTFTGASAGVAEVGFDDDVGWVQLEVVVMASGGSGGGAGGDPVGSGAVGEVDLAVRVAPQVDAGEGLAHDPASVGLDPVVVPAQGSVVLQP